MIRVENFAEHPNTIGELRSDRSGLGADWSVRDMLVNLLRDIDSGKIKPEAAVLIFTRAADGDPNATTTHFRNASPSTIHALGMLAHGQMLLVQNSALD